MIPNVDTIPVEGKRNRLLPNSTIIKGGLYVPEFKFNILFVSSLFSDLLPLMFNYQSSITFYPEFYLTRDLQTREFIGVGKCKHELYRIEMVENKRMAMMSTMNAWHK